MAMQFGRVVGVDLPVSRLVLGTMILRPDALEEGFALLDAAVAAGLNTLDLAWVYGGGHSERIVGQWLEARGNRSQMVILTKGAHPNGDRQRVTPWDIAADLHDSLARLRTPYIDIYLLHRDNPALPVGPIVEALNEHHRAGRIRAFGGSNWTHDRLQAANDYAADQGLVPFTASSPHYSLAEQVDDPWGPGCVGVSGPAQEAARAWYAATDLPLFAYSSLARGFFSGRISRQSFVANPDGIDGACRRAYCHEVNFQRLDRATELAAAKGVSVAQVALAYVLQQPLNLFALVGAANAAEIAANVAALDLELSAAELAWLDLRA
ncbi:MAG: aldo/keto reductase [Fimbriimonadaceae bacterium]|nr:aldo/keto reductase [Fimbriimonadaceae bacterium]